MSDTVTLKKETALAALSALASADAFIKDKFYTQNEHRTKAIADMSEELDVKVTTSKVGPGS